MPRLGRASAPAWSQVRVPTDRPGLTRVEFLFDPEYLRSIPLSDGSSKPSLRTRGVDHARVREITLLDDVIDLDGVPLYVSGWLVPSRNIAQVYHLRVKILAPLVVRKAVSIIVAWDGVEYKFRLRAGSTASEDITPADYSVHYDNLPISGLRLYVEHQSKRPARKI